MTLTDLFMNRGLSEGHYGQRNFERTLVVRSSLNGFSIGSNFLMAYFLKALKEPFYWSSRDRRFFKILLKVKLITSGSSIPDLSQGLYDQLMSRIFIDDLSIGRNVLGQITSTFLRSFKKNLTFNESSMRIGTFSSLLLEEVFLGLYWIFFFESLMGMRNLIKVRKKHQKDFYKNFCRVSTLLY